MCVFGVGGGKADGADVRVPYKSWELTWGLARTRVFSVPESPPFLCIICVGEGNGELWVGVCVFMGMGRGSSLSHRGEGDVDMLAMRVGVE